MSARRLNRHTCSQQEINELLADYALRGKCVCRLKGGDPFVFGRGGEEAAYLKERGIEVMVVPGVTSAIAAPAYAGIPLTDRGCASSFAVITGHEEAGKTESTLDWAGLAHGADTLVFLMGLANLPEITAKLVAHGKPAATPAAVIMEGTLPSQRVVTGTLADIAERARQAGLRAPAVTVVGEVVKLRETLSWFDSRPLFGRRILVTRARAQASELSQLLALAGAVPVEFPVIRIAPLPPPDNLLERLCRADWLVFTSANGLPNLIRQLAELGADIRALGRARLAAIGPATAQSLRRHGLRVDFIPRQFIAEGWRRNFPRRRANSSSSPARKTRAKRCPSCSPPAAPASTSSPSITPSRKKARRPTLPRWTPSPSPALPPCATSASVFREISTAPPSPASAPSPPPPHASWGCRWISRRKNTPFPRWLRR